MAHHWQQSISQITHFPVYGTTNWSKQITDTPKWIQIKHTKKHSNINRLKSLHNLIIKISSEPHLKQHIYGLIQKIFNSIAKALELHLFCINSSPPSATYMRQWIGSAFVQIMACRLFGGKPLSKPMLCYFQLDSWEQIPLKFESEFYHFHSRNVS